MSLKSPRGQWVSSLQFHHEYVYMISTVVNRVIRGSDKWTVMYSVACKLTHWPLGDFKEIFRKVIFQLILMIDGWNISCKIVLKWMPMDFTNGKSTLVQVMAWCRQATSHYLSQCWPRSLSPYGVIRPQWVNLWKGHCDNSGCNFHWKISALISRNMCKIFKSSQWYGRSCWWLFVQLLICCIVDNFVSHCWLSISKSARHMHN